MSVKEITITVPDWCIDVVKAIANHHGDNDNIIPIEKMFSRILYRHMFTIVDTALDIGIPLDDLGDGVIDVLINDIEDMLHKIGIKDIDLVYNILFSIMNISSKHSES